MSACLTIYEVPVPLARQYALSFQVLDTFDTYLVRFDAEGTVGVGEVTYLTGYNHEGRGSLIEDLALLASELSQGAPLASLLPCLSTRSPFFASGLACALETWGGGGLQSYSIPVPRSVPLCAVLYGEDPESAAASAANLVEKGFQTIKIKVGRLPIEQEIRRIRAIAKELSDEVGMRLDANQVYHFSEALALCKGLEALPGIKFLEQPFRPPLWREHERLCAQTTVPIMLDESIWTEADIRRAAGCGVKFVKLKLAKHPGMAATIQLMKLARSLGLGIVFGNGVQTELGNHLELYLHVAACIRSASEANGFLKPAYPLFPHAMTVSGGLVHAGGVMVDISRLDGLPALAAIPVPVL
jgi:L-Ala-D/L-Glu epimerase